MKRTKLFWLACFLAFFTSLKAQNAYYYSDNGKLSLTQSPQHFIISTYDGTALQKLQSTKSSLVKNVEAFSHKGFAIIETATPVPQPESMLTALGIKSRVRSVSAGYAYEDGFVIYPTHHVVFRPRAKGDFNGINQILSRFGIKDFDEQYGVFRVEIEDLSQCFAVANALYQSGLTQFAQPDFYAPAQRNADPLFSQQFQMHNTGQTIDGYAGTADMDCNALEAWGVSLGSNSITVAVIDDGLEAHEDLNDAGGNNRIIGGFTPANNGNGGTTSSSNHGVACAGIIAASHNNIGVQGIAPLVRLLSVNIFFGGETTQDIADGITWAKNNGADVMSNSWGYSSCTANFSNINNAISDAVNNGRGGLGSVVVFASGNGYKSCVDYPANNPNVIAVGAFTNQGNKSDYSNAGSDLDIAAPSNAVSPQPGAGVRTTDRMGSSGYASGNYTGGFGGTSAACPVVSGVAALLLGYNPNLTDAQVKNILYTTATDMGALGYDTQFGYGRVNAYGALLAAGGQQPTCTDGIQNGQETGIDCGGPDCLACPSNCNDNEVTLTIILDNYPEETSWNIRNASNAVVASGGTYGNLPDGSTLTEDLCLPDGCYDFIILDSYGDGICCAYGSGSYSLVSGGTTLASGGSFGSSEVTNFCVGGSGPDTQAPATPTGLTSNNTTQTSTDLSWNGSSDNVGVTGYNVFVDGVQVGTSATTTYSVTGLTANTTYTMSVSAFDAAGNVSGNASTSVTTLSNGGGGTGTVFAHYFETGWDNWQDGGSDCRRYSGNRSWEGNFSIELRDNSGTASSMISAGYDLTGYSTLEFKFYFYANSMENGENFFVEYNSGSGWQILADYVAGSGFNNNTFYVATINMDAGTLNFGNNARFRIRCDASANSDQIYIDEVTLTSLGTTATLYDRVDEIVALKTLAQELSDVMISPNPTTGAVLIQSESLIDTVTVVGMDGKLWKSISISDESQVKVNLEDLSHGMYLIHIQTDSGVSTQKVVKQ